jgi:urea transport system ATP-binding protein
MKLLEIKDLCVQFGGLKAVNGMEMTVEKGEIHCLLGPNGAGKSTTLDLICGQTKATGGQVLFNGQNIIDVIEYKRARYGIGRKFQVPSVFKELTVTENLRVARSKQFSLWQNLKCFGNDESERLEEIMDLADLTDSRDVLAGNLSHGQTQWLDISMLIAQDSKLILMDEPTAGMTIKESHRTGEIFKTLKKDHTLIIVEHDMHFVRQVADKVTVMNNGSKLAEGSIEEIENNEDVKTAYLGH